MRRRSSPSRDQHSRWPSDVSRAVDRSMSPGRRHFCRVRHGNGYNATGCSGARETSQWMGTISGTPQPLACDDKGRSNHRDPISRDDSALCPKVCPRRSPRSAIVELRKLLLLRGLPGKGRFFGNTPPKFASVKKIRRIRKCLRSVYLQVRGEVAERLKAAVC